MDYHYFQKDYLSKNEKKLFRRIYCFNSLLRPDLLKGSGMKPATFYNAVDALIEKKLVIAEKNAKALGIGRPSECLCVNQNYAHIIGVIVTNFEYRIALLDFCANILEEKVFDMLPDLSTTKFLEDCRKSVEEMFARRPCAKENILGLAISATGPIDCEKGVLLLLQNCNGEGWRNFKIREELEALLGVHGVIDNSAHSCAQGIYISDYSRSYTGLAFFMMNRGIGMGVILDGKSFQSVPYLHNGINHMVVDYNGQQCDCGKYGCLITKVGSEYVFAAFQKQLKMGKQTVLASQPEENITFAAVCAAADAGDPLCMSVVEEAALGFSIGLQNFFCVMDVPLVVLGGVFIENSNLFFDIVKKQLFKWRPAVEVVKTNQYISYAYRGIAAKLALSVGEA